MLIKIYFELDEVEVLLSLIASFKIFLKRNQLISDKNRETYGNFIFILNKLLKKQNSVQLKSDIKSIPLLADRTWLLGQLG